MKNDKRLIVVILLIAIVIAVVVWLIYTQIKVHGLAGATTAPGAAATAIAKPNVLPLGLTNNTASQIAAANNGQYQMAQPASNAVTSVASAAHDILAIEGGVSGFLNGGAGQGGSSSTFDVGSVFGGGGEDAFTSMFGSGVSSSSDGSGSDAIDFTNLFG